MKCPVDSALLLYVDHTVLLYPGNSHFLARALPVMQGLIKGETSVFTRLLPAPHPVASG
jgi:hypothetical protein